jgi:hypothetical protein
MRAKTLKVSETFRVYPVYPVMRASDAGPHVISAHF